MTKYASVRMKSNKSGNKIIVKAPPDLGFVLHKAQSSTSIFTLNLGHSPIIDLMYRFCRMSYISDGDQFVGLYLFSRPIVPFTRVGDIVLNELVDRRFIDLTDFGRLDSLGLLSVKVDMTHAVDPRIGFDAMHAARSWFDIYEQLGLTQSQFINKNKVVTTSAFDTYLYEHGL